MAIKLISFDRFTVQYGITNPLGHDLVRVEFFEKKKLVARMLMGSAIALGAFASSCKGPFTCTSHRSTSQTYLRC